ncbi:uncharacterized protein LOC111251536 isoform X2 [Varroa destructor]|uniref:Serine/threonine-protein kinase 11-interacting protein n=1 Tax=Varroa destructor TaxID=109461 RepID=A0A7M7KA47_VARDE|nr:uncharacterized protein LOC111251536 isoform X2 [Varroa destructor]
MMKHNSFHKLADFLRSYGDSLFNSNGSSIECKLCLTTRALVELSKHLSMVLQNEHFESNSFSVLGCDANSLYMRDLLFIHDIFQKVTKLKLVTSSTTVESEMSLSRFGALRQLDLQRVPPHLFVPMCPTQAGQLEVLEAHRCLTEAKAVLKLSGGAPWSRLETLRLSHNMLISFGLEHQTITETDVDRDKKNEHSLHMSHLLPNLRNLDLSHNQLRELDLCGLEYLSCVDLSFNFISRIPQLHCRSSLLHLAHLCLRNNLLEDLWGLEALTALRVLDLGHNMMSEFSVLQPLANLLQLDRLALEGNPFALHVDYRKKVAAHIAKTVILDGQYEVYSERTLILSTLEPIHIYPVGRGRTEAVDQHIYVGETENCPSLSGAHPSSSASSVKTGKTRQSIIENPAECDTESQERLSLMSNSQNVSNLKQVVQEHCRENGHAWLLTAAHVLQLPMAQSTPLPPLSSSQDTNITSEVNGRQKELGCGRKESHQSDDCLIVTGEDVPSSIDLASLNDNKEQALLGQPRGASPNASLCAAVLMTTSQVESIDETSVRATPELEDDALGASAFGHSESDKEESPAIGVIDAEPPEINDEDIEALADTTSDGTFLSAAATPTGDAAGFNVLNNTLEEPGSAIKQTDPSPRKSITSLDDSDRLEEDGKVWARLRELRRNNLEYDAEHSMPAEEKVYLELQVFTKEENFRAAFRAYIVLTHDWALEGFVILSEHRMYVSKPRVSTSECGVLWSVPLCRLRRTTVQLGAQTLVIEVDKNTAEWGPCGGPGAAPDWLLLYIGDTGWCAQLSQLINLYMPEKARTLRSEVGSGDLLASLHLESESLRAYSQGYWRILDDGGATPPEKSHVCIAVASQDVVVVRERHVEPEKVKFTEVCTQSIIALTSLALEESDPRIANVTFALDETGTREQVWYFETASVASMFVFIESLRQPWQEVFDIELPLSYIQ